MLENTFQPINNGIGPMIEKEKACTCGMPVKRTLSCYGNMDAFGA